MDTNNFFADIPVGEIMAKYVDVEQLNRNMENRIATLSQELNDEAAAQLMADCKKLSVQVTGSGEQISA